MRIAIVEDNKNDINILQTLLHDVVNEFELSVEIFCYQNGIDFLNSEDSDTYEVIFLDILMPEISGTQLADNLRQKQINSLIVFMSVSTEYVMESYDVDAFYYLVKPLTKEKIHSVISRLVNRQNQPCITIKEKRVNVEIPVKSIICACSQKHFVEIYLEQRIAKTYMNFSDFCSILSAYDNFCICNRGILINLEYIDEIDSSERTVLLYSGEKFPISKKYLKTIQQKYLKYLFTKIRNGGEVI